MDNELFEPPFNLAGELLDESLNAEGEARRAAIARITARQMQRNLFENVIESDVQREIELNANQ